VVVEIVHGRLREKKKVDIATDTAGKVKSVHANGSIEVVFSIAVGGGPKKDVVVTVKPDNLRVPGDGKDDATSEVAQAPEVVQRRCRSRWQCVQRIV
jgi:hypothetical protein